MTQNQLIELFETEQLKAIVERSEERGWVDPAELEAFVTEQELGSEEVEQITRELEAMGLEVGAPIDDARRRRRRRRPRLPSGRASRSPAPPTRCSCSSPTSAGTSS